ncbi:M48 family metalloprotease [Candidatus Uhrbacteria bacterium]|nr:M48 family metalloprotease [Candidatus Uhrbacteria bacterium]
MTYSEISTNKRTTFLLITVFVVIFVALGWVFGAWYGDPGFGIVLATVISSVGALVSYYQGDKIALLSSGAREIQKSDLPELYNIVENLSIATGLQTPKIYVIQDPSPNAFATGRDPAHASIAVTTGLVQLMDRQELEGVLAHELSHVKNYDIRVMTITVVLVGGIVLLSDWLLRGMFSRRGRDSDTPAALAIIGIALAILSPFIAQLIKLAVSRSREYLADASGALITRFPDGLARALEKIAQIDQPLRQANHATAHLFIANPFDPHVTARFERLFSTHPPIEERIARLRKMGV